MRTIHVMALVNALLAIATLDLPIIRATFCVLAALALIEACRQDRKAAAVLGYVDDEMARRNGVTDSP